MANLSNDTTQDQNPTDLSQARMSGRNMFGKGAVAAAAMALGGMSAPSLGQMEWDISRDPQHQALGQNYLVGGSALQSTGGGVVSLAVYSTAFSTPLRSSLTALWNDGNGGSWALGTYHSYANMLSFPNVTATASTGPNFNTNPGLTMSVMQVVPYSPSFNDPNSPDLALYHLSTEIPGLQPVVFGTAGIGDMLVDPGFGMYGSQATGIFPRDGNVRAFMATVDNSLQPGFNPSYYQQIYVHSSDSYMYAGRALSGFSGSPLFTNGQLYGIATATTNGADFSGPTIFQPIVGDRLQWVYETAVPAPASAALLGLAGILATRRRR
jgi:hypothetical protein